MSAGFIVTRPYPESGIGSNLVSLAGAVWLAGQTGRDVIVDWRNSSFLLDKTKNLFTEFLDPVDEIQGVRLQYADGPTAPWDDTSNDKVVLDLDLSETSRLIALGSDAHYVVLTPFHGYERIEPGGNPLERFRRLRAFFSAIAPREFLRRDIEAFARSNRFDESFVVGVNIATGNGDYRRGLTAYGRVRIEIFDHEERFLRMISLARAMAVRRLPDYLRESAVTFVATDDADMHALLMRLPNAVARRGQFPPSGAGRSFTDYTRPEYTDRDAFSDIVADHFLLAQCDAIVRNPSMFGTYGLVTTNFYGGNLRNIETMYPGYISRAAIRRARRLPMILRRW